MKTHDLRDLTMGDAYDKTQTSDEIRDGDILLVRDGVAIMVEAWPVMAEGISAVFHNVSHGFHAETSEKYAAAFAAAAALKSEKRTTKFEIQTYTLCAGWINIWADDGEPVLFDTREAAQAELADFLAEQAHAVQLGYLEDFSAEDYKIEEVAA